MHRCLCASEKPYLRSCHLTWGSELCWAGGEGSSPSCGNSEHLVELLQWRVYCSAAVLWRKSASFNRQESCSWLWAIPWGTCTSATLCYTSHPAPEVSRIFAQAPDAVAWMLSSITFVWISVWKGSPSTHIIFPHGPTNTPALHHGLKLLVSLLWCFVIATFSHFSRACDKYLN